MAMLHIQFNDQLQHGRYLRRGLQMMEEGRETLIKAKDVMATMMNGDGTLAAHFTEVTSRFGFTDDTTSKAAWDELNSALSKFTTDAQVTSVQSALLQLFSKLR
jgi:hypothetical protein